MLLTCNYLFTAMKLKCHASLQKLYFSYMLFQQCKWEATENRINRNNLIFELYNFLYYKYCYDLMI